MLFAFRTYTVKGGYFCSAELTVFGGVFPRCTGISVDTLNTFDGVFEAARKYYDWSGGQNFMQINDYYNYAFVGMKAYGGELVRNGSLRLDDDAFKKIW